MLRIEVRPPRGLYPRAPGNRFFGNPLAIRTVRAQGLSEIFALGLQSLALELRPCERALWVGDVGQNNVEEVDRVDLGGNYGWRCFEGTRMNTDVSCGPPGPFCRSPSTAAVSA